jgi:cytochrome P450
VILRILGFDEGRWSEFAGWVHTIAHGAAGGEFNETALEAAVAFYAEIWAVIEERRNTGFTDDIVSKLLQAEFDGRPLSDDDVIDYTMLLLFGGLDTTTAAMGNALVRMAQEPAIRDRLIREPHLIPAAVEEFVRLYCPAQAQSRTLAEDVELGGQHLAAGERVLMLWASANRDPAVFSAPDAVDLDRMENRHLGFGVGLHRCLGASLARSMFRIMLECVLQRIPDYELVDDPDSHRYPDAGTVYGLDSLPARFRPGTRRQG